MWGRTVAVACSLGCRSVFRSLQDVSASLVMEKKQREDHGCHQPASLPFVLGFVAVGVVVVVVVAAVWFVCLVFWFASPEQEFFS